jgi:hypothetical protein
MHHAVRAVQKEVDVIRDLRVHQRSETASAVTRGVTSLEIESCGVGR